MEMDQSRRPKAVLCFKRQRGTYLETCIRKKKSALEEKELLIKNDYV